LHLTYQLSLKTTNICEYIILPKYVYNYVNIFFVCHTFYDATLSFHAILMFGVENQRYKHTNVHAHTQLCDIKVWMIITRKKWQR